MQDKLEKFIQDNREQFDSYEPSPDLWKKIIKEDDALQISGAKANKTIRYFVFRVAAVLLVAVLSIFAYEQIKTIRSAENLASDQTNEQLAPEIIELMEAETYYGQQVDAKMKELESYSNGFADVKADVLADFEELDAAYTDLLNELGSDIYKQEVIESMIENYRLKIAILEEVIHQLDSWESTENNEIKGI
jgi:hypothetical protein